MNERQMQKWAAALRGRRQWTELQARDVLQRQGASGESVTVFARRMGFVPQRLYWWSNKLQDGDGFGARRLEPAATRQFAPVVVREAAPIADVGAPIVVRFGDRVLVEVHHPDATTAAWVALVVAGCANGVAL
jgi:transposase-like protein